MTTNNFLREKELNWTRIEGMREEMKLNQKTIDELKNRNNDLYTKMRRTLHDVQKKAEEIDKEYV